MSTPAAAAQVNFVEFNSSNHWFMAERSQGFFRSTDQGASWTPINSGLATTLGWAINVNPANGDLIASTFSGGPLNANPVTFYHSTDEGNTWATIPYGHLSAATAQSGCAFAKNTNIVCGGYWAPLPATGGWVSTDGGVTTISVSMNSPNGGAVFAIGTNPSTGDLWMGTEQYGIFRSTDNGMTWTQESPPDQNIDPVNGIRDGNIYGITFDRNGNILFGSQGGIWKSSATGSGYTWTNVFANGGSAAGKGLGRNTTGDLLFYGHTHDSNLPTVVYCSTDDGNNWSACDAGIPPGLTGWHFGVNPNDGKLYAVVDDETNNNAGSIYVTTAPVQ